MYAALTLTTVAACSPAPSGVQQWKLPDRLKEISGLAMTEDGRLLAHDDERGVIYELDYVRGRILDESPIAEPTPEGDFEGIAVLDGQPYLITSDGLLYSQDLIADTHAGRTCEVEGLTARAGQLVAVCKTATAQRAASRHIRVLFIDPDLGAIVDELIVPAPVKLKPSGIEWDAKRERFLVIAADQRIVVAFDASGASASMLELDLRRHRQPEGIAVDRQGRLIVADEGGKSKARLTIYGNAP